ncbi:dynein axonemal assembly factor 11 [Euwallacea fornicatus]|uniref:dynein axonemal assembly factor 11 n=1 Tax=Euwallacea fornicatus TaxID=995702 RepID=UPI00338D9C9B
MMKSITEDLIRKKSEHNEGIIGSLEELSLHQENIQKIEHINNWCKKLQILYLQANQISKIENLNKLKELQYLNLAINNIEKIENLERCESLEKLDLTLNFIGDLESVKTLRENTHLRELYLTGNPCCDFKGYREYVIIHLTQLTSLDGTEIRRSERIHAKQNLSAVQKSIAECQEKYKIFREEQKIRIKKNETSHFTNEKFWQTVTENSPETRVDIAKRQKKNEKENDEKSTRRPNRIIKLFDVNGRPLNTNQTKLNFTFSDEDPEMFILDIAIYKYLDTSLIDIDLQPTYVKITIKNKIFQMVLPEEVQVEQSTALRSQTTGHLVLKLIKLNYKVPLKKKQNEPEPVTNSDIKIRKGEREYLEVSRRDDDMDFSNIVENKGKYQTTCTSNPEVPMLEYA